MNAHPELIEITRLSHRIKDAVSELLSLSNKSDTIVTQSGNMINFNYVGRGSESIGLSISDQYSTKTRTAYLTETLSRLNQIKAELTA
ncbi:MAG: hypothetical protein A2003_13310 [Acinetobacter sp. GWC1_38_13]|uniref:hypothetical protein n=1 Tax=Acinetobacter sp. GWC1_38_13 TaxID=1797234 RepID=UPI0008D15D1A|nr:hypothetical protein [Acinetobacter sp. GWC1_38_13]OFW44131.1 MAG: hypothetical protein A2003_13310 [Acinetobacter sp. GWC1_38_13]HAV56924.1 hypothetical protein [Acinetobacter junii]